MRASPFSVLAAAGILCSASPGAAQTPLAQAVQRAVERHPEVRQAEAEAQAAALDAKIARNAYLPSASAAAGPALEGFGYELTASQTVYDWGQAGRQIDRKRAALGEAEAALAALREDVALSVIEVRLDLESARRQLQFLRGHLERLAALAAMTRERVEQRYSDQAEAGRIALALATARGTQEELKGDLADAADHYDLLVGEGAPEDGLPPSLDVLRRAEDARALEAALAAAPLYRQALLQVEMAKAGLREARAQRFPRLALESTVQRREISGRMVDDTSVALRFRLGAQPGLSAMQRPRLEARRLEAAASGAEAVGRDLRRMARSLAAMDRALAGRIAALAEQAQNADAVREVYREQFLVGRRDIQDLVLMETEQFEAERQVVQLTVERLRLQHRAASQLGLLLTHFQGAPA